MTIMNQFIDNAIENMSDIDFFTMLNFQNYDPILDIDSYKASQFRQYPENTTKIFSYIIPRKSTKIGTAIPFGAQAYAKKLASIRITKEMVDRAQWIVLSHGEPFNRKGWMRIVNKYDGKLPLSIRSIPEGLPIPAGNAVASIVNTDDDSAWLTSYVETGAQRAVWFPTTVASESYAIMGEILASFERTSDRPQSDAIFKLHNFGDRGASSEESAGIAGAAHLTSFFGTDSIKGLIYAMGAYNTTDMPGFSIIASEHSTMCSNSDAKNRDDYAAAEKMVSQLEQAVKEAREAGSELPVLTAGVGDTYNIYRFAGKYIGERLKDRIINSGGTFVLRPDSGNPLEVPLDVIEILMEKFGYTVNSKGYKVLPDCIRVIQGDGINKESIKQIIANMEARKISIDNLAFGMGGALTQKLERDTMSFAMKACAMKIDGEWVDIFKDPITDSGKTSKGGQLTTYRDDEGNIFTDRMGRTDAEDLMVEIFRDGEMLVEYTFEEVRARCNQIKA